MADIGMHAGERLHPLGSDGDIIETFSHGDSPQMELLVLAARPMRCATCN
jgi:hypothetical protein